MTVRFVRRPEAALDFLRWQALVLQPDGAWLLAASGSSPGKLLSQLAPFLLERCEAGEPFPENPKAEQAWWEEEE